MTALVVRAAPTCLCADSVQPFADDQLDALWTYGVRVLCVYLQTTSAERLAAYVARGFGVFFVGESRAPGWVPSAATGAADAQRHLQLARALGLPAGVSLFDDDETPDLRAPTADRIAHVDGHSGPVSAAGFLAGAYLGAAFGLTSAEWQARPALHRYGKSCSIVADFAGNPVEPARGYSWVQGRPPNLRIGSAVVDLGLLTEDYRDDAVACVWAA